MDTNKRRLLLKDGFGDNDIASIAWDLDWSLRKAIKGSSTVSKEVIYDTNLNKTFCHYLADNYVELKYVILYGPDLEVALEELSAYPYFYTLADVTTFLEAFSSSSDDDYQSDLILKSGIISGFGYEPAVDELFKQAIATQKEGLQLDVVIAIAYSSLKAYQAHVDYLVAAGCSQEVKDSAQHLLNGAHLE